MPVVLGYDTALWPMSTSLDTLPIGVVYAIRAGVGMVGAAMGGVMSFQESVTPTMLTRIVIVA